MNITNTLKDAIIDYNNGNKDAFSTIYDESNGYIYTCISNTLNNENKSEDLIADIMQDTYIDISKNIKKLDNAESFLSWSATIARRKTYSYLKQNGTYVLLESDENFNNLEDITNTLPEDIVLSKEKQEHIRHAINDNLTDIEKECVLGYYYNDMKQKDIAEKLEIPQSTVASNIFRAKSKMRKALQGVLIVTAVAAVAILLLNSKVIKKAVKNGMDNKPTASFSQTQNIIANTTEDTKEPTTAVTLTGEHYSDYFSGAPFTKEDFNKTLTSDKYVQYTIPKDWNYTFDKIKLGQYLSYEEKDGKNILVPDPNGTLFGFESGLTNEDLCRKCKGVMEPHILETFGYQYYPNYNEYMNFSNEILRGSKSSYYRADAGFDGTNEYFKIGVQFTSNLDSWLIFREICIVNGYAKDETTWKQNNRAKKLNVYLCNDYMPKEYIGSIELVDTMLPQYIDISDLKIKFAPYECTFFIFEVEEIYEADVTENNTDVGTYLTGLLFEFSGRENINYSSNDCKYYQLNDPVSPFTEADFNDTIVAGTNSKYTIPDNWNYDFGKASPTSHFPSEAKDVFNFTHPIPYELYEGTTTSSKLDMLGIENFFATYNMKFIYNKPARPWLIYQEICLKMTMNSSETDWNADNRAKKIQLYFQDNYMGTFEIEDTDQYQYIDISQLKIKVVPGTKTNFTLKVVDIYEGNSEYMTPISTVFYFSGGLSNTSN